MLRVLIITADPRAAKANRGFVDRVDGFAVAGWSGTVAAASEATNPLEPDLILLDLDFPEGGGVELLQSLRPGEAADVIVVASAAEVSSLPPTIRDRVAGTIIKPYSFERFAEVLRRYRDESGRGVTARARPGLEEGPRHSAPAASQPICPKGIDELTLKLVTERFELADRWMTAKEFGTLTGLSRTTARRYLEYLVTNGRAMVRAAYGSVGRPERLYGRISEERTAEHS